MTEKYPRLTVIPVLATLLCSAADAAVRTSGNYRIESDVFGAGGGLLQSIGYRLEGTLGQPAAPAEGVSTSYILRPGYAVTRDSDGDGSPDDIDTDDDNDTVIDAGDAFPRDLAETVDTDGDRIGNNSDSDDDGDGMPDAFEIAYNFDPLDPGDANGDADSDGLTNLEEFLAGRNPTLNEGVIIVIINSSAED